MKRLIFSLAAFVCGSAMAAGQFEGLYQSESNPEQFYTLHQNGNQMLLGGFGTVPTDGNIYLRYGADQFRPPKLYIWDVQHGVVEGSTAIMTGGIMQNACTVTYRLEMTGTALTATILRAENRLGGVNCAAVLPVGSISRAIKMF